MSQNGIQIGAYGNKIMAINNFHNEYSWLSNFYPVEVVLDGHRYPSVEHAYVAAKTVNHNLRHTISLLPTPGKAKTYGRKHVALRTDWEEVKLSIMRNLLRQKFKGKYAYLSNLLLETYPQELIEGNHWNDTYWGVCNGEGENNLGKLLMEIREELR